MSYSGTTENLNLPQWILSDPPQMADFNSALLRIDQYSKDLFGISQPSAARQNIGINKTLWSSSTAWTSGTIVVPGSSNYSLFAIDLAGSSSRVLLMREGNTLRGIGGFMSSASRLYINTAEFTSNGDTWTYGTCGAITLQASGISVTETAMGVYGIYGII